MAKKNGVVNGTDNTVITLPGGVRHFKLASGTPLEEIPKEVWPAMGERFGTKPGELPTKGSSVFVGRIPSLGELHSDALAILRRHGGQEEVAVSASPVAQAA